MGRRLKAAAFFLAAVALVFTASAPGAAALAPRFVGAAEYRSQTATASSGLAELAGTYSATADFTATDYDGLVRIAAEQFVARSGRFTVKYVTDDFEAVRSAVSDDKLWRDIFSVDLPGTTSDLDYLRDSVTYMRASVTWYGTYGIFEFTQTYATTASQETYVDSAVALILESLGLDGKSQYEKVKAIHDYVVATVDYDYTCSKYSAFDALYSKKAVCNGYALLMYKLLMEAGVPARKINGAGISDGKSENHTWNIVKIGRYWYNLDATWDDTAHTMAYFLKSDDNFPDHIRDSEFATPAFMSAHPMSPVDFDPSRDFKLVQSVKFPAAGGVHFVGETFTLEAFITPEDATDRTLVWTSSDPSVASVDGSGHVTVHSAGAAVITAAAADGSGKSAAYTVTAKLPDLPSEWAKGQVAELSGRGVVPKELMSDFRSPITRGEFTALVVNAFEYLRGVYTPQGEAPFSDISSCAYAGHIAKAYALGLISGVSSDRFAPDSDLTREQCAKIIGAAAGVLTGGPVSSTAALPFDDAKYIHDWAVEYVRYAVETGLMNGTGSLFEPQGALTREQAMVIAERLIEKFVQREGAA